MASFRLHFVDRLPDFSSPSRAVTIESSDQQTAKRKRRWQRKKSVRPNACYQNYIRIYHYTACNTHKWPQQFVQRWVVTFPSSSNRGLESPISTAVELTRRKFWETIIYNHHMGNVPTAISMVAQQRLLSMPVQDVCMTSAARIMLIKR